MKKILLSLALLLSVGTICAQEQKEELKAPLSEKTSNLSLAIDLARYGYKNQSPIALVQAAQIVMENGFEKTTREVEGNKEVADIDTKLPPVDLEPTKLLADARQLAGKDKHLLAIVDNAEKQAQTRGRVGGMGYAVLRVPAYSSITSYDSFYAGQLAEVALVGDGTTDMDLYIYDQNGNLITSSTDYSDRCICQWYPRWTGTFRIVIRNRGSVYNDIAIATN